MYKLCKILLIVYVKNIGLLRHLTMTTYNNT